LTIKNEHQRAVPIAEENQNARFEFAFQFALYIPDDVFRFD